MLGTLTGVTAFLALLLFAVQLTLNLYATSVVTAVGFDAARIVAGADVGEGEAARRDAEARARSMLPRYDGDGRLHLSWSYRDLDGRRGADVVELRIVAQHPAGLLAGMRLPYQRVDRTIRVRVEALR